MRHWKATRTTTLLLLTSLLGFSVGTPLRAQPAWPEPPRGQTIYDAPQDLPAGKHGDLIWATEIKTLVPDARAWKVLYRSTDINNKALAVTGMVIAPDVAAPSNGRPVVSYAHGTTGLGPLCGISRVDNPAKDASMFYSFDSSDGIDSGIPGLTKMIKSGYVVVATDYNGLGPDNGVHQYLVGPTLARNTLDIITAARQLTVAGAGKKAAVFGWSEGGQAAVWAGQIADYSAGQFELVGSAGMAPVNVGEQLKLESQAMAAGVKLPIMATTEMMMARYASTLAFDDLNISDVLTPFGVAFIEETARTQCSHHVAPSLDYWIPKKGSPLRNDPQNQQAWASSVQKLSIGLVRAQVPTAIYQGDDDPTVMPSATRAYMKTACANGSTVEYRHYANTDHIETPAAAIDDFLAWVAGRFEGKPAPSSCATENR